MSLTSQGVTLANIYAPVVDTPPVMGTTPNPIFVFGTPDTYDLKNHYTDDGLSAVTHSLSAILPNGLTFSASTGVITYDGSGAASSQNLTFTATDGANPGVTSASFTVQITSTPDVTVPNTPTGLASGSQTSTTVDLSWNAATDPNGATGEAVSGVTSYNIYRDSADVGSPTGLTFTDTGLVAETSYDYQVSSVDGASNESTLSSAVPVSTAAAQASEWSGKTAHYVRAGAGGATGADWANATNDLPANLTRDHVYYVADGSYSGYAFNDAVSGTLKIYVVKATEADHGTETGWVSTYGDGQANFTGQVNFWTSYHVFDGQTRNESTVMAWKPNTAHYGFRISELRLETYFESLGSVNNVTVKYTDIGSTYSESPSAGTIIGYGQVAYLVNFSAGQHDNITVSRCAIHNYKGTGFQCIKLYDSIIEYCFLGPGWGKEAIRGSSRMDNCTIRYNMFWQSSQTDPNDGGSGITAEIGIWNNSVDRTVSPDNEIYGNIIYNTNSGGRNSVIVVGGDDVGWYGPGFANTKVYNNTIIGMPEGASSSMINLNGSTTEAKNNLFYDTVDADVSATSTASNIDAVSDPFVNYASLDVHLSGAQAGTSLGSPFNKDIDGVTRGGDGTFDAGAFEYEV